MPEFDNKQAANLFGLPENNVRIHRLGEGFNAIGYEVVVEGNHFLRALKRDSMLTPQTPMERALSAVEGTLRLPHTLPSRALGLIEGGRTLDLSTVTDVVTLGDLLPDGSVSFLDMIRKEADSEEDIQLLIQELQPFAKLAGEALADIHNSDLIPDDARKGFLYARATRRIIHDTELTAGVSEIVDFTQAWISPQEVDMMLPGLMNQANRASGVSPERLTPVHGDYWAANIFFHPDQGLLTNDTRIGFGEPGADMAWLIGEFLMQDLIRRGEFGHEFTQLAMDAFDAYQATRPDPEITKFMGLGYGFQSFAEAVFTENLSDDQRRTLFETGIGALASQAEGNALDISHMSRYTLKGQQILEPRL